MCVCMCVCEILFFFFTVNIHPVIFRFFWFLCLFLFFIFFNLMSVNQIKVHNVSLSCLFNRGNALLTTFSKFVFDFAFYICVETTCRFSFVSSLLLCGSGRRWIDILALM